MLQGMHSQRLFRRAVAIVVTVMATVAFAACSGGQKADPMTSGADSTAGQTTTTAGPVDVDVTLGATELRGPGANHADPPPLAADVSADVLTSVDRYVTRALVDPLRGEAFDPKGLVGLAAAARLADGAHDRGVVTTEGLPEVEGATVKLAPVDLVGLTEGFGSIPLVSARIDFEAELDTAEGRLELHHFGELVLSYLDGWKVVGYEMIVVRDDGTTETTTTAQVAP